VANFKTASTHATDASVISDEDAGPPDRGLEVFDPQQVYLLGVLPPPGGNAIAPVQAPNDGIVGFDDYARGFQIRPSDGRLLYELTNYGILVFGCDGCHVGPPEGSPYPASPEANDARIARQPCSSDPIAKLPTSFMVGLNDEIIHTDAGSGYEWCDEHGVRVASELMQTPLSVGAASTVLRRDGIWRRDSQELVPITGLPEAPIIVATRARDDGYWLALGNSAQAATRVELWHAALDGTASKLGDYPEPPAGLEVLDEVALDGEGRLHQIARERGTYTDCIIRRTLSSASETIYSEASIPHVMIGFSELVTGP
jgi:hypothetical protein